jgi:prophage antirepressor-like protein
MDDQSVWYVAADVCRCLGIAINTRTGKPNVTVATRQINDQAKKKYRIETPENPKNPWIDMMIVSPNGMAVMLEELDLEQVELFKSQVIK